VEKEMVANRVEFMKLLEELRLSIISFDLVLLNNARLPAYKGSTLRGGLGRGLKEASCKNEVRECKECSYKFKCIYSTFFETPIDSDGTFGKLTNGPHSFVIEPPLVNQTEYFVNDKVSFKIILFGNAVDNYDYFVSAVEKFGKAGIGKNRAKFAVDKVKDEINNETLMSKGRQVFLPSKLEETDLRELFNRFAEEKDFENITLKFVTPARIKYRNKLTDTLPFYVLVQNLIRRVELLQYFYGEKAALLTNYKELIGLAQDVREENSQLYWYDWERYSSRQGVRMKLGGLKGTITYSGNIEEFLPLIFLGSYIHIGKGTSFGLGKYEIS